MARLSAQLALTKTGIVGYWKASFFFVLIVRPNNDIDVLEPFNLGYHVRGRLTSVIQYFPSYLSLRALFHKTAVSAFSAPVTY